jgi:putative colanic acid biosysnthesis UDP-glucose lipid carrier transferase
VLLFIDQTMTPHRQSLSCAILTQHFSLRKPYLIKKRLLDIGISLLVILTLYPLLFPLIMLLIRLDSPGPIFFRQKRVGFMGGVFSCYKFRTMQVNDLADIKSAVDEDSRITRIGKFLRKSCLDELPQFINVLAGDMSVVGPRPHMLLEYARFSKNITNYAFRTLARPGITGLSQVIGFRGPVTNFDDIYYRYQLDVYYMRRVSLQLDLWIMARTAVLMARSLLKKKEAPRQQIFKIVNI